MAEAVMIDTHAHLDDHEYRADFQDVRSRMLEAGVTKVITVGTNLTSSRHACILADQYPEIFAAVGVHPHDAVTVVPRTLEGLRHLASGSKVVAWGEVGLDYHYNYSPRECQLDVLRKQLELAGELNLPVIIHDRDAHWDVISVLDDFPGLTGVIVHCFSGDLRFAQECVKRGYYLGIGGTITFPKNKKLHDVVQSVSLKHMVLETDCPYLAPQPWRGKRNEPAFLTAVLEKMACLKAVSREEAAQATTANAEKLFRL